mmetsp:Transcript_17517/g.44903  ORF Transcript_17517/g.44903 Transcript_17517/m.44903 type:complete len:455 (-) Transcript_17517:230-1594(-)|eukprot:CAMPEP_0115856266 /NCGR_PEP_ID=MMETSP0287-20121206/14962_1 /TAXON_ID=412157 /ORGANISM="Chrysochromulina rotalis, Strain UIO044" /LENGTH=454 /DNA_ID=CAMNT_0003310431 /DNA_START=81 /DNA_END=1445 /DNA_ORIENTATION=+
MWRLEAARAEQTTRDAARASCVPSAPSAEVQPQLDWNDAAGVPSDPQLAKMRTDFWRQTEQDTCWTVPMGRDLKTMPWLPHRSCGMLEAMLRARRLRRRTVLLVDNTADRVVDTFFLYRPCQVIEAKMMVLDERMKKRTLAQIRDHARQCIVNAMKFGQILLVRMSNTAASFATRFSDPKTLPMTIFDHEVVDSLRMQHTGPAGDNLYLSDHPLAACLREADTEFGHFTCRPGFEVIVSTHFGKGDVSAFLDRCLPLDKMQAIRPVVTPHAGTSAGERDGLDVGGAEQAEGDDADVDADGPRDDASAWGLGDAQVAAARLARRVEEMRARRGGPVGSRSLGSHQTSSKSRSAASTFDPAGRATISALCDPAPITRRVARPANWAIQKDKPKATDETDVQPPPSMGRGLETASTSARSDEECHIEYVDNEDAYTEQPPCLVQRCYASRSYADEDI